MASSVWKGHLTFGLISIPVRLFSAARSERISLNQLHKECHTRIRQPLFCPTHNRIVERNEIVKGFEYEKDQYVLFNEEDLEKIAPPSARTMEILEFVKLEEMDPIYFDASYYMTPEDAGKKAYALLLKAMEESGYGAIAKLTMHQRENIVLMRPHSNGLMLHTMYYANEVRQVEEYGQDSKIQLKDQEKKLALQLIESLAAPFQPEKYHDQYQTALKGLIDAKLKGEEITEAPHPKLAPVIDLMDALKKSLAEKPEAPAGAAATGKRPPLRAVPVPAAASAEEPARAQKRRKKVG